MRRSRLLGGVLTGLVVLASGGCSSDPQEQYCATLSDQQQTLRQLSAGADDPGRGDLARFIDVFETLRDAAPDDVVDEWDTYVTAWQALESALADAGADESMFTDGQRPEGMSRRDYRRISAAAADLRSTRVVAAGAGIEQQALDVCKIDLAGSGLSP
ncbi:MAG: hypothetical protein ACTHKG_14240 [Nocardioides sp.]